MDKQVIDRVLLKLDSASYRIIRYKFEIEQPERNGQPFGQPKIENFEVSIISDGNDSTLMLWGVDSVQRHDGSIDFMSNGALISQITFNQAYCVGYANEGDFDLAQGNSSIIESIKVIPATLVWNNASYELTA